GMFCEREDPHRAEGPVSRISPGLTQLRKKPGGCSASGRIHTGQRGPRAEYHPGLPSLAKESGELVAD
ncbi:MAG: hypothetical protein U9R31_03585, partial [Candidatus Omnitrophota bacterium]|nr:hypothetical protein [Candidatus Omnitrophota bacterium]